MIDKSFIIVGGGFAGLFAARVLENFGVKKIKVVEKDNKIGGLLGSLKVKNPIKDGYDYDFDFGTHFILGSKNQEINNLINLDLNKKKYNKYENSLLEGQYFNGLLYQKSGCPNVYHLSEKIQKNIRKELSSGLNENPTLRNYTNLNDFYIHKYGKTATEKVFKPIINKFTNLDLKKLSTLMDSSLFPSRLIIEDEKNSRKIKINPYWDSRIAFPNCKSGFSEINKYYPKDGGVGEWTSSIFNNLKVQGVEFSLNTSISNIKVVNKKVKSIDTSDNHNLKFDHVLWTLPAMHFSKVCKMKLPSKKPYFCKLSIVNFIFDLKPIIYPYYIYVYDNSLKSYRITIYENFNKNYLLNKKYKVSVEVIQEEKFENFDQLKNLVFKELKLMKIISEETSILWSEVLEKKISFPILTQDVVENTKNQINIIENSISNIDIIGTRSNVHGQIAIMQNIYDTIKSRLFSK